MQTATTIQKKEPKKKVDTAVSAPKETSVESVEEHSIPEAGVPLFLQRFAASVSPPPVQREEVEEEDSNETSVLPKLIVGASDDEYEQQADQVADTVMRMPETATEGRIEEEEQPVTDTPIQAKTFASPNIQPAYNEYGNGPDDETEITPSLQAKSRENIRPTKTVYQALQRTGGGTPIPETTRSRIEPILGTDLSQVKVHTDTLANQATRSIYAKAFTHKDTIFLGEGQSAGDVSLMAHEAAHVVQQESETQPAIMRCNDCGCEDEDTVSPDQLSCAYPESTGGVGPLDPVNPPECYFETFQVRPPGLENDSEIEPVELTIDDEVFDSQVIEMYAVPLEQIFDTLEEAESAPPESVIPEGFDSSPRACDTLSSYLPFMSCIDRVVYTPDGTPIRVIATGEYFAVTTTYTKFAVGAGSLTLVETASGPRLIDAGINKSFAGPESAISDAIINRLRGLLNGRSIVEILITHLHYDHGSLLSRLYAEFEIGTIRANAFQWLARMSSGGRRGDQLQREMLEARRQFTRRQVRVDLEASGGAWESHVDAANRELALESAIDAETTRRLSLRESTIVNAMLPVEGRLVSQPIPLETLGLDISTATSEPVTRGLRGEGISSFVDPNLGGELESMEGRERSPASSMEDRQSTTYIIDLIGRARLYVLSDQRTVDIATLAENFRTEVQAFQALNGIDIEIRIWDMTHHMQSGFVSETTRASAEYRIQDAPSTSTSDRNIRRAFIRAEQLVQFTDFLHSAMAEQNAAGRMPGDALIVSAQHDASRSLIDPSLIWLLRSMGMEVFLAANQADVQMMEVQLRGGERVSGVVGNEASGGTPSDPLLRRASAASLELRDSIAQLESQAEAMSEGVERTEIENRITRLEAQRSEILSLKQDYISAMEAEFSSRGEAAGEGTTEPARAQAERLRTALEGFTEPVVGEVPRFTELALVVVGQERLAAGNPAMREVLESRARLSEYELRVRSGLASPEVICEYTARLMEYDRVIEQNLAEAPEGTRQVLEAERSRIAENLSGTEGYAPSRIRRIPGVGRLLESTVRYLPQAHTAARVVGRGLGAWMVYQTFEAQSELEARMAAGRANEFEYLAGTAHNALGIRIGLQMVRGVEVSMNRFVILSVLDVAQTALRGYQTDEEWQTEVSYATLRNAVNLGLFYLGSLLMRVPHPFAVLAGLGIMFIGDPILEAIGAHDLIEQYFGFLPGEVTDANQHLRDLLNHYRRVVGALELQARSNQSLTDLGAEDTDAVRRSAGRVASTELDEARDLEADIFSEFQEGYEQARVSHAGLVELDEWADEFLDLQYRAHGRDRDVTRSSIERFDRIQREILPMDDMSRTEVQAMPQWRDTRETITEYRELQGESEPDWEEVNEKQRDIVRMIQHARYRLDPGRYGSHRRTPLLSPGNEAYDAYQTELAEVEEEWYSAQLAAFVSGRADAFPYSERPSLEETRSTWEEGQEGSEELELALYQVDLLIDHHAALMERQPPLSNNLTAESLYQNSIDASGAYLYVMVHDRNYRVGVERLILMESVMVSALERSRRLSVGQQANQSQRDRLDDVETQVMRQVDQRRETHAFLSLDEAEALRARIRTAENRHLINRFAPDESVTSLTREEEAALATDEMEDIHLFTTQDLIERIYAIRRENIYRVDGTIYFYWGLGIYTQTTVDESDNILVILGGGFLMFQIRPLNREAAELFGDYEVGEVYLSALQPVNDQMIQSMDQEEDIQQ